jgi:ubiquitin-activating enzyme E1
MSTNQIDESLYSRQLYAYGHEAMSKMKESNVLICGVGGLGVEIAKNVILSGVKSVTLYDPENVTNRDLSSQYYFSKEDVGKNRVGCCIGKLTELNSYVLIEDYTGILDDNFINKFSVVVLNNYNLVEQIRINGMCRSDTNTNTAFISCTTKGLFGKIFSDFGPEFKVTDTDGEEILTGTILNISNDVEGVVTCANIHGLTTGHKVTINSVSNKVDNRKPTKLAIYDTTVKYVDSTSFKIDLNTTVYGKLSGGTFTQQKESTIMKFASLAESLKEPKFIITNFADFERPMKLHACYLAYNEFVVNNMRDPTVKDYDAFVESVKGFSKEEKLDDNLIRQFIHCLPGDLCPMQAVIGGTAAQEVMKACSGKYTPIDQWLYFDSFDCLPDNFEEVVEDITDNTSRYSGQVSVFGKEFQNKLASQKWFVVGAGAIGCEHMKNFAMMGLASNRDGKIFITDMDTIEKSNLNRQFLFRSTDIGGLKSKTAATAVKVMNPDINVEVHENRVGPETENFYNIKFYKELDGVANALDNIQARLYMDSQCVFHKKPLLESGTLSTKGNVQVVVPDLTESYGSSRDPPEESIPVCTLKNFPYEIAHTIQYARDQFEGLFTQKVEDTNSYIRDPTKLKDLPHSDLLTTVNNINLLLKNIPTNFEDCMKFAFKYWHTNYRDNIKDLLVQFPSDAKTSSGEEFWSGSKRCPKAIDFDFNNHTHLEFLDYTALLWAGVFNLTVSIEEENITQIYTKLKKSDVPQYTHTKIHVSTTEEEEKDQSKKLDQEYSVLTGPSKESNQTLSSEDIIASIPTTNIKEELTVHKFEKDDDSNYHIDFITTASNMRASNYGIASADRHSTKRIAGKIIPAICTTTSVVSGLVCLEMYKIVQGFNKVEKFNNGFINLGINMFAFSDPIETPVTTYRDKKFTMWDSFEVKGDITLEAFLKLFRDEHDYSLSLIAYEEFMIFSMFVPKRELDRRMSMNMKTIVEEMTKTKINKDMMMLAIDVEDEDEDEEDFDEDAEQVDLPSVKYYLV